jgi:hypothetical protein
MLKKPENSSKINDLRGAETARVLAGGGTLRLYGLEVRGGEADRWCETEFVWSGVVLFGMVFPFLLLAAVCSTGIKRFNLFIFERGGSKVRGIKANKESGKIGRNRGRLLRITKWFGLCWPTATVAVNRAGAVHYARGRAWSPFFQLRGYGLGCLVRQEDGLTRFSAGRRKRHARRVWSPGMGKVFAAGG